MKNILIFTSLFVLVFVIFLQAPMMYDYNRYVNATRNFLASPHTLYTEASPEFFYLPWSMIILVPLSLLPDGIGQSIFMTISLFIVMYIAYIQKANRLALILTATNVFVFSVIASAQWDIFTVLAMLMAVQCIEKNEEIKFSIWMLLAVAKPTYAIIPTLWILWHYRKSITVKSVAVPTIIVAFSFIVLGWDWILRYISFMLVSAPQEFRNMSILNTPYAIFFVPAALVFFLTLIRAKVQPRTKVIAAILLNLILSPYVQPYHLSMCFPAVIELARRSWVMAIISHIIPIIVLYKAVTENAIILCSLSPVLLIAYPLLLLAILAKNR